MEEHMSRPTFTRAVLMLLCIGGCRTAEITGRGATHDARVTPSRQKETQDVLNNGEVQAVVASEDDIELNDVPWGSEDSVESAAVASATQASGIEITVRRGDSLVGLAYVAGVSVESIVDLNEIDPRATLQPGATLLMPLEAELADAFMEARTFAREDRLGRYISGRGGLVSVEPHSVRTGETGWGIAHGQAGVPVWVLASFNPDVELDQLGIGQHLQLPVFADSVASAETVEDVEPDGRLPYGPPAP